MNRANEQKYGDDGIAAVAKAQDWIDETIARDSERVKKPSVCERKGKKIKDFRTLYSVFV